MLSLPLKFASLLQRLFEFKGLLVIVVCITRRGRDIRFVFV